MITSSIYLARNNLSSLIKQTEFGETVELTRHDKPVAVIMSYQDYQCVSKDDDDFLNSLAELKSKYFNVLKEMKDDEFTFPVHRDSPSHQEKEIFSD